MFNRRSSLRVAFAGLTLCLITSVSFASPWSNAMKWFGFDAGQPAAEATAPALPITGDSLAPNACEVASAAFPIEIDSTGGVIAPTAYGNLAAAVAAINAGTHTGVINVQVCFNSSETASFYINSSLAGAADYSAINIYPLADNVTISGPTTAGRGLIELNGADNVTIDGDNPNTAGTNRNLTLTNTAAATITYTSVIRIATASTVPTADNNIFRNLNINGSATGRNASGSTSTTGSENTTFGIYAGGNASNPTTQPSALTSVTANSALASTTINALSISNNAVNACARGIVFNGAAASVSNGVTVSNNMVGDQSNPAFTYPYTAPTTTVYSKGIHISGTNAITVSGNTVKNIFSYVQVSHTGIELEAAIGLGTVEISDNSITGVAINAAGTFPARGISVTNSAAAYTISRNTVRNIQNSTSSTVITNQPTGLYVNTSAPSGLIEKNRISTIVSRNTGTYGVAGVFLNGGNNITFQNNFIWDVTEDMSGGLAFSTQYGVSGLRISAGTGHKIYHNSINLYGSLLGTSTSDILTAALMLASITTTGMDIRNNIFANTMTGGTTSIAHVAIYITSGASSSYNLTLNNNDYFSGTDAARQGIAQFGITAGTGFYLASNFNAGATTPATNLRSLTSTLNAAGTNDNATIVSDPQFLASNNLHIQPTSPAESAGANLSVTTDIDNDSRGTTPDMGADETTLIAPGVLQLSSATYSGSEGGTLNATVNRTSGTSGTVGVTYTLSGGDATGGPACLVGIDYINTGGILSFGDGVTSQPIAITLCSDAVNEPNETFTITLSAPTGGASIGAQSSATATIFNIAPPFSGSYNVGSGETFTSLTNPGGIFQAINNSGLAGNTTIEITSDLTGETGSVALNPIAGGFTLTIKPSGAARAITSTASSASLIALAGADNVTIDGSLSGGTDRSLTLTNQNPGNGSGVIFIGSQGTGAGATNNTIKNTIIRAGNAGTTAIFTYGIFVGDVSGASAGADNDNLTIQNNQILRARTGIQAVGTGAGVLDNLRIEQNQFGDPVTAANSIGRVGMTIQVLNNANVANNEIRNVGFTADTSSAVALQIVSSANSTVAFNTINGVSATAASTVPQGIHAFTGTSGLSVNGNTVTNVTSSDSVGPQGITIGTGVANSSVTRNNVTGIRYTGSGGYGGKGIEVNTGNSASNITVGNNFVSNITGDAWSAGANILDTMMGIRVTGTTGGVRIFYNSVNMGSGSFAGNSGSTISAALYIGAGATALNVANNILVNNLDNTAATDDKNYAFYSDAPNTAYLAINYNDYWVPASTASGPQVLGFLGSDRLSLSDIQTATGQDFNSMSSNPLFTSATDLHIASAPVLSPVAGMGISIVGFSVDFDADIRSTVTDIGADEIVQTSGGTFPSGTFYNAILTPGTYAGNVTVTNSLTIGGGNSGVNIGANTLTIGCNATVTGGGGYNYIVGNTRKDFCAPGTFTFPVGTTPNASRPDGSDEKPDQAPDLGGGNAPEYTPVDVNITTGTFPSSLTVSVTDDFLPQIVQANGVSRYWTVTETGDLTANMTFHYLDAPYDVNGNESLYKAFRRSGGFTTEYVPSSNNPAGNTFTATGVTNFSDWGAGAAAATSSNASIAGRVTTANGNGIRNAMVMITGGSLTAPIVVNTGAMGYYSFDNLRVGETYVIQIGAKRFRFANPTRVVTLQDAISDLDFVANPQE